MKIKNKKRFNTIIAAFVAVFIAGGAFAFVAAGPLLFNGTANVDAELELSIMDAGINPRPPQPNTVASADMFHTPKSELGKGEHQVSFSAILRAPGDNAHFVFKVENTGTMDAAIHDVTFELATIDGQPAANHRNFEELDKLAGERARAVFFNFSPDPNGLDNWAGQWPDTVFRPGDSQEVFARIHLEPIPEEFGLSRLEHSFGYTVTMTYGLPN